MRKVLVILFAIIALVFGVQNIYAADSAFKNTLLKIEITQNSETSYNIGLYTQKIYNEPVQVIQKSDNIYYFLLPETNHSVTSVPAIGAITNVVIKTYPYAGQDVKNGYTKVAIMTTKPVDFTTTLKTMDSSISPRLDPSRLARLDEVFAKYADKLAKNDIPSPLHQFKKAVSSQVPVIQQAQAATKPAAQVKHESPQKISSASNKTNSLDEYQNKLNKEQAAKKNQAATKSAQQSSSANKQAKTPVQHKSVPQKSVQTSAKSVTNSVQQQPKNQQVSKAAEKPAVKENTKQVQPKKQQAPVSNKIAQTENKTTTQASSKNEASVPSSVQKEAPKKAEAEVIEDKKTEEYEKQLPTQEPVSVEFKEKGENKTASDSVKEEAVVGASENENSAEELDVERKTPDLQAFLPHIFLFLIILIAYAYLRARRKNAQRAQTVSYDNDPDNVQELLNRIKKQNPNQELQTADTLEQQDNDEIVLSVDEEDNQEAYFGQPKQEEVEAEVYASQSIEQENEISQEDDEAEKIAAFNNYMDSIQENDIVEQPVVITPETKDDEIIQQLYTPIETPAYEEYNEPVSYEEPVSSEDNDVATIVSSSKLTETRGLYLAKFEGSTSLVGYIQDDIYVLYNFGEEEISETKIESNLAEETDTDSLYIVKTGGKKLMVKSTPYDMSLEMVM